MCVKIDKRASRFVGEFNGGPMQKMRFSVLVGLLATVMCTPLSRADFSTDSKKGSVECSAEDDFGFAVDEARKVVIYTMGGNPPVTYPVVTRESDGDTYVSYVTEMGTLSFDDQGDNFLFAETGYSVPLDCR
jgi:hypothetical protein